MEPFDRKPVMTTRRSIIAVGGVLLVSPKLASAGDARAPLTLEKLLAETDELSALLPALTRAEQNAYVVAAAARGLQARLVLPTMYPMGPFSGVEIGPGGKPTIFAATFYRMAPHSTLPARDHPGYSVASIGLAGEVTLRQFEAEDAEEAKGPEFSVRETVRTALRQGVAATLTPMRDNIHTFQTGAQGASWVDLSTSHGPEGKFTYLDISAAPIAGDRYEAKRRTFTKS